MEIKTPEQIAAEQMLGVVEYVPLDDDSVAHWTGVIVAAIEADRVQRNFSVGDPVIELRKWAVKAANALAIDYESDLSQDLAAEYQGISKTLDGDEA